MSDSASRFKSDRTHTYLETARSTCSRMDAFTSWKDNSLVSEKDMAEIPPKELFWCSPFGKFYSNKRLPFTSKNMSEL